MIKDHVGILVCSLIVMAFISVGFVLRSAQIVFGFGSDCSSRMDCCHVELGQNLCVTLITSVCSSVRRVPGREPGGRRGRTGHADH